MHVHAVGGAEWLVAVEIVGVGAGCWTSVGS